MSRVRMVDAVKGMAIILVVYGHVLQSLGHRNWWNTPFSAFQDRFIYSFHMPAFFFVAGLFLQASLARSGTKEFIIQRFRTVLWPYIVFGCGIYFELKFGSGASHGHIDLLHQVFIPFLTGSGSWFLPTLFLCLILAVILNRLPGWLRFALALVMNLMLPIHGLGIVLEGVAKYFVYLTVGELVGKRIEKLESMPRWSALASSALVFLMVAAANLYSLHPAKPLTLLLGLAGTLALFLLAAGLKVTSIESAFAWCGVASLGIFVLHPFFQGALHFVIARLFTTPLALLDLLLVTTIAVVGPGLIWHYQSQLHLGFLFKFPWGSAKKTTAAKGLAAAEPPLMQSSGSTEVQ